MTSKGVLLCCTGCVLAVHFATWAISLLYTSMAHSLLFVSATPLLIVLWALLRWAASRSRSTTSDSTDAATAAQHLPPTLLEGLGTVVGFAAAAVLAAAAGSEGSTNSRAGSADSKDAAAPHAVAPSAVGDAWALAGATAMVFYLGVGGRLRQWMPLFLYAFPVTASAAVAALFGAWLFEGPVTALGTGPAALFGWLGSWQRFGLVLGAAVAAGIIGHTGSNFALRHISPLVISLTLLLEPVIGSAIGYAFGFQGPPGGITAICGIVLVLSAAMVTLGDRSQPYDAAVRSWLRRTFRGTSDETRGSGTDASGTAEIAGESTTSTVGPVWAPVPLPTTLSGGTLSPAASTASAAAAAAPAFAQQAAARDSSSSDKQALV